MPRAKALGNYDSTCYGVWYGDPLVHSFTFHPQVSSFASVFYISSFAPMFHLSSFAPILFHVASFLPCFMFQVLLLYIQQIYNIILPFA